MIKSRIFQAADYDVVSPWFIAQGWPQPPCFNMLPHDTGIVIEEDGEPMAAGFLYLTNSPMGFFEWIVTKPGLGMKAKRIIMHLFDTLKELCAQYNIARIMHMTNPKFSQFLQKHFGFEYSETAELLFLNTEKGAPWQQQPQS